MGQRIIFQNGKGISQSDSVVSAQGGSLCFQEISLHIQPQAFFFKINVHMVFFFTYHIHMALYDNGLGRFITFGTVFEHNHVIAVILYPSQTMLSGKRYTVITDGFCISGAMGNLADFFKICKNSFWFQLFTNSHIRLLLWYIYFIGS